MKHRNFWLAPALLSGCLFIVPTAGVAQRTTGNHRAAVEERTSRETPAVPAPAEAKVVSYGDKDVVEIKTKLRYSTLLVLPKNEQILDFTCGDKDWWVINGAQNFAYIKPAKAGARTNLNLITAAGNVYSFGLVEVSDIPDSRPDLKVFIQPTDQNLLDAANEKPKFVSAREAEDYKQQVAMAKDETRQVKQDSQTTIDRGISRFVFNVRFSYRFEAGKKPFYVRAMYHDEHFTYIQARPEETPTLYEIKDGQPNLVNFDYKDGIYVVSKILDRGYLAIGKQKLAFTREE